MSIDPGTLWDFNRPDESEGRFRAALATAGGDDALILTTQIARTWGLRRDFRKAAALLDEIETAISQAGPEARARFSLERGRSLVSAAHPADAITAEARARARAAFIRASEIAREGGLDAITIDALHMLAFADPHPADQLRWGREALMIALHSGQPAARAWEASLRNNIGCALHALDRRDEALEEFRTALSLREATSDAAACRIARWMVAWTLRTLGRTTEALVEQTALERDCAAAGAPDPHVYAELEHLYRVLGRSAQADDCARKRDSLSESH